MDDRVSLLPERLSALPQRLSLVFKPRRLRKAVKRLAVVVALGTVFVISTAAGVALHISTKEARRVTGRIVNAALEPVFRGRIVVGGIQSLSVNRAEIDEAWIYGPDGEEVIHATGIAADVNPLRLLRSLQGEATEPVLIVLPRIHIEKAEVTLLSDAEGIPTIANAFMPRDTGPPSPIPPRPVAVAMPRIEIEDARAKGDVGIALDARLRRLSANIFIRTDETVAVDVDRAGIAERAILPGTTIKGVASYNLRFDLRRDELRSADAERHDRMRMWATLDGAVGEVPASARATMEGLDFEGTMDLPHATPEALHGVFPWLPIARETRGRVKAAGHLPDLAVSGTFEVPQGSGVGTIVAEGDIAPRDGVGFELHMTAAELDPRALFASAPDMRVSGRASVRLRLPTDRPADVSLEVSTAPSWALGQRVPAADAVFDVVDGELLGSIFLHEDGFPIDARLRIAGPDVAFSATGRGEDLSKNPRLAGVLGGSGSARLDGTWNGEDLAVELDASGNGLSVLGGPERGFSATSGDVHAKVSGKLGDLAVQGEAHAKGVRAQGEDLDDVVVRVDGPALAPRVTAKVRDDGRGIIDGSAKISMIERAATDVTFSIEREGIKASGSAARVGFEGGSLEARGVKVSGQGLGSVGGDISLQRGELIGNLHAEGVDIGKVARLFALQVPVAGVASAEISLRRVPGGRKGSIEVEVEGGRVGAIEGVSARVSARFDGKQVESTGFLRLIDDAGVEARDAAKGAGLVAHASLCDGPIAEVRFASGSGQLDGPLLSVATWRRALGEVDVAAENARLDCLTRRFPEAKSPVDHANGLLSTRFHVRRKSGDPFASIDDLYLRTRGLEIVGKEEAWSTNRIDAEVTGDVDGTTGALALKALFIDGMILADADLDATLDLGSLLQGGATALASIKSAPVIARVRMPRRSFGELKTLPYPLNDVAGYFSGELRVAGELDGSLDMPRLRVEAQGFSVLPAASTSAAELAPPLDLDFEGTFDPLRRVADAALDVTLSGQLVGSATAAVGLAGSHAPAVVASGETPWRADLDAELYDFPLGSLPFLAERDVSGAVSGKVKAHGLHDQPTIVAELTAPELHMGEATLAAAVRSTVEARSGQADIDAGAIDASTFGSSLGQATFELDVEGKEGGKLNVLTYAGTTWKDLYWPSIDRTAAGGLALNAQDFRLAALYPVVTGFVSRIDGRLDGKVALEWGRLEEASKGTIKVGELRVTDAIVYIPQIGQELREGKAHVVMQPERNGKQDVMIQEVEAKGSAGRVHGDGRVTFAGLEFERADGTLTIDEDEALPVTLEGVPLGSARGEIQAAITHDPHRLNLLVTVPSFTFELPQSSSRDVQTLDDAPGVHVMQPLGPEKAPRDPDAMAYAFTVNLKRIVLKSSAIDARLSTAPGAPLRMLLSDRLHAQGDILFDQGNLELNGKKFEVDSGLVRLRDEDTGNPYVNLTAHWEASGDSRVFVDYVGLLSPITDDKIRFRSDPPRSQAEIASLLVFGDSGATATGLAGTVGGSVATSLANGLIANAFGGALRDVLAVSVGTTEAGGIFGAQVALSDEVSLGGTFEQIQGDTSVNRAGGGCGDLYFDYKMTTHWSLRGTGGYCYADTQSSGGTSNQEGVTLGVDVLWQYRY